MKGNRANTFLFITSVLSMLILLIGATFSYFTVSSQSKYDAVSVEANKINLALSISSIYTGHKLIPTNDEDIMLAYNNKCVDIYTNGACLAYGLEISNFNKSQDIIGEIDFTVDGIENLSYMVLDENNKVYLSKTEVTANPIAGMSLGPNFVLGDGAESNPTSRKFVLLVWLTNLDKDQTDLDAGGSFSAQVSYESVLGNRLSATVNGIGEDSGEVSDLGGVEQ